MTNCPYTDCSGYCQMKHVKTFNRDYTVCPFPLEDGETSETYSDPETVSDTGKANEDNTMALNLESNSETKATTDLNSKPNSFEDTGFDAEDEDEEREISGKSLSEPSEGHEHPNTQVLEPNNYTNSPSLTLLAEAALSSTSHTILPSMAIPCKDEIDVNFACYNKVDPGDSSQSIPYADESDYESVQAPSSTFNKSKTRKRPVSRDTIGESTKAKKRLRTITNADYNLESTDAFTLSETTSARPRLQKGLKSVSVRIGDDYLHTLSKEEVYKQLIDCFRLYMDGEPVAKSGKFDRHAMPTMSLAFEDMLSKAACKFGFMPSWWDHTAIERIVDIARDRRRCE